MSWAKLSDDFADDCWGLSDAALRLHVEGLTWSARKLLDCRIPHDDLRRFAKCPEAVQELVDVGWWSDDGGHYVIRHHANYQRTREEVLKQQAANAANGKRGGRPRRVREQAQPVVPYTGTDSVSDSVIQSSTRGDRPGQARTGREEDDGTVAAAWPPVAVPGGRTSSAACARCGEPMVLVEPGQTTHPTCDLTPLRDAG